MTINQTSLKNKKNLLAFSAGVDSTALFFILLNQNIPFDIAIVDYNVRVQSKLEVNYAKELASRYNKKCFTKEVKLPDSNFEKNARDIRYDFFKRLILEFSYDNLLTAHQLNDKLEWFLMQLSKGAGLVELIGLSEVEPRDKYTLVRPVLKYSKNKLLQYLQSNNIKYFTDESNFDHKYKRNYFRNNFTNQFLDEFNDGIKRSFNYLEKDIQSLEIQLIPLFKSNDLDIFKCNNDDNKNIRTIDKNLKKRGLLLSKKQRDEILRQKEIIISNKIAVSLFENLIWIAPLSTSVMEKSFKELCRINKIPKNIRPYLYSISEDIRKLRESLVL